jgi:hypothetical protein
MALVLGTVAVTALAGCESTPEPPEGVAAAQAVVPDGAEEAPLVGVVWQPVDLIGCQVPWGLAVMVEDSGIASRQFTFTSNGAIQVRQVEVPQSPDTEDTYSLAYSRDGSTLRVRAGLGVDTWTIRQLTTARLLLESENGQGCWLRRVG